LAVRADREVGICGSATSLRWRPFDIASRQQQWRSIKILRSRRSIVISTLYVCLCGCLHISRTTCPIFAKFFACMLPMPVARVSSGGVATCRVFPVFCMTSCLRITARNRRRYNDSKGISMDTSPWRILKMTHRRVALDRGRSLTSTIVLLQMRPKGSRSLESS